MLAGRGTSALPSLIVQCGGTLVRQRRAQQAVLAPDSRGSGSLSGIGQRRLRPRNPVGPPVLGVDVAVGISGLAAGGWRPDGQSASPSGRARRAVRGLPCRLGSGGTRIAWTTHPLTVPLPDLDRNCPSRLTQQGAVGVRVTVVVERPGIRERLEQSRSAPRPR